MDFSMFINLIISSSIMAGLLVILIFIIRKLFNKLIDPKWFYIIWFVLIVRLAVPYLISSPFNVSGLFSSVLNKIDIDYWVLFYIWIGGVAALTVYTIANNIYFWFKVKDGKLFIDHKSMKILAECKEKLGVNTNISIIQTTGVSIPAIFGVIRPWLLIPDNVLNNLKSNNLRYVFMHELAHLKRKDILVNWVVLVLQIIHWFNPLVWIAFNKMRADREIACDSEVLSHLETEEKKNYGHTILDLAEIISGRVYFAGIAGILEDKSQVKNRIKKISQFGNKKNNFSFISVLIIILLAGSVLVNANDFKLGNGKKPAETPIVTSSQNTDTNTVTPTVTPIITPTPSGTPPNLYFPTPIVTPTGNISDDTISPAVILTYPDNNQTDIRIDYLISLKFSENIYQGDSFTNIVLYKINGNPIEINAYISNSILVINHVFNLKKNTGYILYIPATAIKDAAGNSMETSYVLRFYTGVDTPLPTKSVTPTFEPSSPPTTEPTATPTIEPTTTPTVIPSGTPTPTPTPTVTPTGTPVPTPTPTVSPTGTPIPSSTPTTTLISSPTTTPTPTLILSPKATSISLSKSTTTSTIKPLIISLNIQFIFFRI
ncbi:MAG: M56 family metallopeptidase [Clostridia bacterium]